MWNFIMEYIMPIFLMILIILAIILITGMTISLYRTDILKQDNYIQNLEEKLNIYEQNYDQVIEEDSIRQVQ